MIEIINALFDHLFTIVILLVLFGGGATSIVTTWIGARRDRARQAEAHKRRRTSGTWSSPSNATGIG